MKKIRLIILLTLITLYVTGCVNITTNSVQMLTAPKNQQIPVGGTWKIIEVLKTAAKDSVTVEEAWLEKTVQFTPDYMVLGEYLLKEPRYKIKRVDGEEYLLYSRRSIPKNIALPSKEIDVITITDQDKYFCEILRLDADKLVLEIHNYSFYLEKISDETTHIVLNTDEEKNRAQSLNIVNYREDNLTRTGVLVGLRALEENGDPVPKYRYRTLWIAAKNKELHPILETKDIFFPRKSGFWKMEVQREMEGDWAEDFLLAYNVATDKTNSTWDFETALQREQDKTGGISRQINYVGNDYVSIETAGVGSYKGSSGKWKESRLQIVPIDNLSNKRGVTIRDLAGEEGISSMEAGRQRVLQDRKLRNQKIMDAARLEENFGLERKMGHWFYKGRVSYFEGEDIHFVDYNINLIPSLKLVFYDELSVPWTQIKDKIPGTIDVYTSPNKDIALVVTKSEIMVYGIDNGQLQSNPLGKIALEKGETIIMAEWATGSYVENWEQTFMSVNTP
ncbi:hypothetical protein [Geosporobacter ferrireducens]|uniref:hypothetical protein n=1 Tax=Geosporobacter ferrireducens TaxID=1424294 RepID=UPI00139ECC78|nr:hypothetical protein [Geosporobacter ferrireducens]MTI54243.1 hypothetical protein [Geosporobacter ferrireducens]